jgi:hypothetical protein
MNSEANLRRDHSATSEPFLLISRSVSILIMMHQEENLVGVLPVPLPESVRRPIVLAS